MLRYIEEEMLAVKVASVVMIQPGRSSLSIESEQVSGSVSSM